MKKNNYDYVFITNIPSFYKVNMYNELAKKLKIYVIFIAKRSSIRSADFFNQEIHFEHSFINNNEFEKRNRIETLCKTIKIVRAIDYSFIVFPGWEIKELLFLASLLPKKKNAVAIESSIIETKKKGVPWLLKKIFLNMMSVGLPSGYLQNEILKYAKFKGTVRYTHGVGVLNQDFYNQSKRLKVTENKIKYLYVGRLSHEKNLGFLCEAFIEYGKNLTVAGYGPLMKELKSKFGHKIDFIGEVNNKELIDIYLSHDVLILPSTSEVWGLVIEEALCCGLAVVVSDKVGSKNDLVLSKSTGLEFYSSSKKSLAEVLNQLEGNFNYYIKNVSSIDLNKLKEEKVTPYIELIRESKR